jgi:Tfp pilus assembly protein PilN
MSILEQYYRINQTAGVSIHLKTDGTAVINCCSLTASGNRLDMDQKLPDMLSVEELNKHLSAKTNIALNLSGKGILHKQVEKIGEVSQGNFSKILPNGNIDDFYVQNFISGDWSFVSIVRKAEADKWINRLKELGFVPLSLSLGPFPVEHILPQLNIYGSDIQFGGNLIERTERGDWKSYRYQETALTPFALKVESEGIDEKLVIPYASAFQLILASKLDVIEAGVASLEDEFKHKLDDQKLRVNGAIILFAFFALLLINFVVFSQLDFSNARLASQVSRLVRNTSNVQDVGDQIRKKESLLEILGWEGGVNKSALVDQLAALMPEEISLQEVAVDPIDLNTSRAQRSLTFFNRRIRISGMSDKIVPVNEWMARIKTRSWVKSMQMESYTYNNELNTGQFTITLDY